MAGATVGTRPPSALTGHSLLQVYFLQKLISNSHKSHLNQLNVEFVENNSNTITTITSARWQGSLKQDWMEKKSKLKQNVNRLIKNRIKRSTCNNLRNRTDHIPLWKIFYMFGVSKA